MPKTKKQSVARPRVPPPPAASAPKLFEEDDEPTVPLSPGEEEAYGEITRIMDQLGDEEAKVVLRRRSVQNGTLHHVGVMTAVDFDIERVIQDYGGGRYEAAFYTKGVKRGAVTFDIDPSIPARLPSSVIREEKEPPSAPYPQRSVYDDPGIAGLKEVLSRQSDLLNQLVVNMATGGRGAQGVDSQQAIDLALRMVEIISNKTPAPESTPVTELKDMFIAGIEAAHAVEGGKEDSYWPVVNKFADPVIKVLETALARERGGPGRVPPARPAVPSVAAAPAQPVPESVPAFTGPSWILHLRPYLPTLMGWAKAGKDPELYAEVILDNLEQGAVMEIQAAAQDPQFVDKTLAVLPMFQPYSAWATQILTHIKELVTAPPEQDDGGGGSGDG